jgi:hypothetical protein
MFFFLFLFLFLVVIEANYKSICSERMGLKERNKIKNTEKMSDFKKI